MRYTFLFIFFLLPFISQATISEAAPDSISIEQYLKINDLKATVSDQGIYYHIETYGDGEQPNAGDYVMVRFKGMLLNGKIFDQSNEEEPFVFQLGYRQVILGWEYGIPLFQVGSKGVLYIPSDLGYGKTGVGSVPPDSPLMFEIEVLQIMNFDEYDQYMVDLEEKHRRAFEQQKADQFKKDKKIIHEYLADHKIKGKRDDSGISYALTKKGKGDHAKEGDILEVAYTGYLMDDSVFDKGTYTVELGKGKVIAGWEAGLPYFKKGSEGWLLVPSKLAYGPRSIEEDNISIPGNSVLAFKIKVLNIQSK